MSTQLTNVRVMDDDDIEQAKELPEPVRPRCIILIYANHVFQPVRNVRCRHGIQQAAGSQRPTNNVLLFRSQSSPGSTPV